MISRPPLKRPGAPRPTRLRQVGALLLGAGLVLAGRVAGADLPGGEPKLEYQVKAGFLANFGKLTDWPAEAERATNAFRIGIIGESGVWEVIRDALSDKQLKGRSVEVIQLGTNPAATECEIVFITRSQGEQWRELLPRFAGRPVLTVGESEGFAQAGGHINLTLKDQKIRLEINLKSANQAGLKISSKMAAMATVVAGKGGQP